MCTVSMVMDAGRDYFRPSWIQYPPVDRTQEILDAIASFRELVEKAQEFDEVSGQPDCHDPEKVKLMERVDELEKRLAALENG